MSDWLITHSYQTIKELVKWNKECHQTKTNKLYLLCVLQHTSIFSRTSGQCFVFLAHAICNTMTSKELRHLVGSCRASGEDWWVVAAIGVTASGGNWWVTVDQSQPSKLITN